jgi:2-haloalkanoic acid dehalogenase type II
MTSNQGLHLAPIGSTPFGYNHTHALNLIIQAVAVHKGDNLSRTFQFKFNTLSEPQNMFSQPHQNPFPKTKALIFDLMGTCTNWHASILKHLESLPPPSTLPSFSLSELALSWRSNFFISIHDRFENGLPQEDIDDTHRRILDKLLEERGVSWEEWGEKEREMLVHGWHEQEPWADVIPALQRLKQKFFVVVLANGTTRLQLDIVSSASLPFHMLFSSHLLGLTKPDPKIYRKCAELIGLDVEECVMVAAHAYDVRAAKEVGMGCIYIRRWSEDVTEDFESVERDMGLFVDGRDGDGEGLGRVADVLGC